ncbi:hypothetical protein F5X99DRAFT_202759 [Biscogniauxia marginata]|nr:hypothetical protein F5X99DRAFT_202759 [Biscogniauxia marginata]
MLAVALLVALLGLVEASLKTPRIASPSPSSTSQTQYITATTLPSAAPPNAKVAVPVSPATEADVPPEGTSGARSPETTPPPEDDLGGIFHELYGQQYTQTTYWSCATFALETHCGWHEPILEVDSGAARIGSEHGRAAAIRAGVVAGVVGLVFRI